MKIDGLSPYWFDVAQGGAVRNTVDMQSLYLLTGPNGGGKSSLLRSICAAALLGICGFMVPAESAVIPHFDCIMLHMKSYDSPADKKSSFQVCLLFVTDCALSAFMSFLQLGLTSFKIIRLWHSKNCGENSSKMTYVFEDEFLIV